MNRYGAVAAALRRQLEKLGRVNDWLRIIQDSLYPPTCLLCGDPGHQGLDLCAPCRADLPWLETACPRCARPLTLTRLCGQCLNRPPAFDTAQALFHYEEPARQLITSLKFGARYPCARLLGNLLAERLAGRSDLPAALIPVPLHPGRYRERGFNQALEIARGVSRRLNIPLRLDACRRIRPTLPQTQLKAGERRKNLRRAFIATSGAVPKHLAILDDVVTTASTVDELARVLRRAGAERIEVWTCARA